MPVPTAVPQQTERSSFNFGSPGGETADGGGALDFTESRASDYKRTRFGMRIHGIAGWLISLLLAAFFFVLLMGASLILNGNQDEMVLFGCSVVLVIFVPLVFVGLGIHALQRGTSWGLALAGAIAALILSLVFLVLTAIHLFFMLSITWTGADLGVLFLELVSMISGLTGGILALMFLSRPEARDAFQTKARPEDRAD